MARFRTPKYAVIAGALALLGAGGFESYQHFAPHTVVAATVTTAEIAVGNLTATVSATGSVAAPAQSKLTFASTGRLTQLLVGVGDTVTEGQPLAKIDDSALQAALAQALAAYNSAAAKLDQTRAGSTAQDIASAQAQVDAAKIKLAQLQAVPQGADVASAQSQLASAQTKLAQVLAGGTDADVAAARAQLDAATAKLDAVQHPRAEDVAAAQSQVTSAQLKLQALLNPRAEDIKTAEDNLAAAQAKLDALLHPRAEDVAAAQLQLDQAQTKLAQLQDQAKTATPQDVANAQLAVQSAQVAYDKALADSGLVGKTGGPSTQQASDQAVKTALITLQTAQNNLTKLQEQGPTEWDVRQAQLAVDSAQAALQKVKTPAASDIQQAQLALDQAQVTLAKARTPSAYDVQQAQETVAQAQTALDKLLNPSAADVSAAQQSVVAAQTSLDKLQHPTQYDVQLAQETVNQAHLALDKLLATNQYDVQTAQTSLAQAQANLAKLQAGPTTQDVTIAQASVDQAQAALDQARANLEAATLTAPYTGTIAAVSGNVGEQASSAAVTLVNTSQPRVEAVVGETDITKIKVGQPATLTFDALSSQRLNGTVAVVAPTATTTNGVVNYTVYIQVDPQQAQAAGVRPGMTASASIVTDSRQGVVVAPNRAIKTQGRTKSVQVLDANGTPQTRAVQVGLSNDTLTEILSGLQAGDKVVIPATGTAAVSTAGGLGGAALGGLAGGPPAGAPPRG